MSRTKKMFALLMAAVMVIAVVPVGATENAFPKQSESSELSSVEQTRSIPEWKTWSQSDSRWGSCTLGSSGKTMADVGCAVTSVAKLVIQSGCKDPNTWNVLDLLTAFDDCSSLASATFLGAPPASFGSNVFSNCASDFIIYYTESHASEWSPNGETTWNGYPIQMIADPQPQIPVGDVNGDGVLSFVDVASLYNSIISGGAFTAEQAAICDVNGDGSLSFADVAALYNTVLGSAA